MDGGQPDPGWQRELVGRAAFLPPLGVRCAFAEIKIWPRRRLVQFLACMVRGLMPHGTRANQRPNYAPFHEVPSSVGYLHRTREDARVLLD